MPVDSNIPTEVKELLKLHPGLACTENGRIKCTVTNHEMPCRHDSVLQHVKGKKYLRLTTGITGEFDITKYEPHIMPSNKKGHENQLFCTLTLRHLNKIPSHLEKHVNGKRYKKAKAKWEACQLSGEKFVPLPLLQRKQHLRDENDNDNDSVKGNDKEVESDTDSFSDLYPEKYFERLKLSSDEGVAEKMETKSKTKKKQRKKEAKKTETGTKRKNPPSELAAKRKKLNKKSENKEANLITFD